MYRRSTLLWHWIVARNLTGGPLASIPGQVMAPSRVSCQVVASPQQCAASSSAPFSNFLLIDLAWFEQRPSGNRRPQECWHFVQ